MDRIVQAKVKALLTSPAHSISKGRDTDQNIAAQDISALKISY